MLKIIIIPFIFLLPLHSFSQNITGLWRGNLEVSGNLVPYELAISEQDQKLGGYSYASFFFNGVENIGVKTIKIKRKGNVLSFEDEDLIYDNYTTLPRKVKLLGSVTLLDNGTQSILRGSFYTRSLDFRAKDQNLFKGTIELKKQSGIAQSKLVPKLSELNLANSLSFIAPASTETSSDARIIEAKTTSSSIQRSKDSISTGIAKKQVLMDEKLIAQDTLVAAVIQAKTNSMSEAERVNKPVTSNNKIEAKAPVQQFGPAAELNVRKTEIITTVLFESDSLEFSLYDNGEIDGDIVSVVLNNEVIIAQKALTASPIRTKVKLLNRGDSLQLIMYAENLGSIPPNTGLLVIQDGLKRTEVRFAGDLKKNAAIILKRK